MSAGEVDPRGGVGAPRLYNSDTTSTDPTSSSGLSMGIIVLDPGPGHSGKITAFVI